MTQNTMNSAYYVHSVKLFVLNYNRKSIEGDDYIMKLIDKLYEINKKDIRANFADFYVTFDFEFYYTKSMISYILNGKREAGSDKFKKFLENCIVVYGEHARNYNDLEPSIKELLDQYNKTHEYFVTPETLQGIVNREVTAIKRALSLNDASKTANDVRDVLTFNLINSNRDLDNIFNNLEAYRELEKRLMRAQIGDGQTIYSIQDISDQSEIDVDILNNLYKACHHKKDFENVYEKLVSLQKNYDLD